MTRTAGIDRVAAVATYPRGTYGSQQTCRRPRSTTVGGGFDLALRQPAPEIRLR